MRNTGILLAFGVLLLVVAACGRGTPVPAPVITPPTPTDASAVQPTASPTVADVQATLEPTALPASPVPTTEPVETAETPPDPEDLPPAGLVDVLTAKVERGEWTYEEGLLFYLKMMAGEVQSTPAEDEQPVGNDGTGIIFEAKRYLLEGSDPDVKAEIERLLGKIAPSAERLLEYAAPAPTSRLRPPGVAARIAQDEACADLWEEGFPPGSSIICLLYLSAHVGEVNIKVYYPSTSQPPGFSVEYAQNAMQGVIDSVETYSKFGKMDDVDVVFTILADPDDVKTLAMVPLPGGPQTCQMIVYPASIQDDQQYQAKGLAAYAAFRQTIAHEMFHCFQGWNIPALQFAKWDVQDWWGESTAEYFSNVVYPAFNTEWGWVPTFNVRTSVRSILELSYENFIFFQFLANRIGNDGVLQMVYQMPTKGGIAEQASTLAAYPEIQSLFHDFGKDFFDSKIADTSGPFIPTGPPAIPSAFDYQVGASASSLSIFNGKPFSLTRYLLRYKPEAMYAQSKTLGGLDGLHDTRHTGAPGLWSDFPELLPAACGDPAYYVLLTSTTAGQGTHDVSLTSDVQQEMSCDKCLVGTWDLYRPSFEAYMYDVMSHSDVFSVDQVGGLWRWSFSKDGIFKGIYDNFFLDYSINQSTLTGSILTQVLITMNGPFEAVYWTDGVGGLFAKTLSESFSMDQTVWMNGDQVDQSNFSNLFEPGPAGSYMYACSPTQLSVVPPISGGLFLEPLIFNKVSNAPMP